MSIFKAITISYCEKIFQLYTQQSGEKLYTGYEASLVSRRNEFARCLIEEIKTIEIKDNDYSSYFTTVQKLINTTLEQVKIEVAEYNKEHSKNFTTDLYESMLTLNLKNYVTMLSSLYLSSNDFVKKIPNDVSLFRNSKEIPWINQFTYILYDYILEKELKIITTKIGRDIFDEKIKLIHDYIEETTTIVKEHQDEQSIQFRDRISELLKEMCVKEQGIQNRTTESTNLLSSFWSVAKEAVTSRSELGKKIDVLIQEFNERTTTSTLQNV